MPGATAGPAAIQRGRRLLAELLPRGLAHARGGCRLVQEALWAAGAVRDVGERQDPCPRIGPPEARGHARPTATGATAGIATAHVTPSASGC